MFTSLGVDTVTYTFTVTNQGNTPLTSVTVTDPLLGGLLTAIPSGDTNTNGVLDITETWVYVQDYSVTQSDIDTGSITNQATATGEGVEGLLQMYLEILSPMIRLRYHITRSLYRCYCPYKDRSI